MLSVKNKIVDFWSATSPLVAVFCSGVAELAPCNSLPSDQTCYCAELALRFWSATSPLVAVFVAAGSCPVIIEGLACV